MAKDWGEHKDLKEGDRVVLPTNPHDREKGIPNPKGIITFVETTLHHDGTWTRMLVEEDGGRVQWFLPRQLKPEE